MFEKNVYTPQNIPSQLFLRLLTSWPCLSSFRILPACFSLMAASCAFCMLSSKARCLAAEASSFFLSFSCSCSKSRARWSLSSASFLSSSASSCRRRANASCFFLRFSSTWACTKACWIGELREMDRKKNTQAIQKFVKQINQYLSLVNK